MSTARSVVQLLALVAKPCFPWWRELDPNHSGLPKVKMRRDANFLHEQSCLRQICAHSTLVLCLFTAMLSYAAPVNLRTDQRENPLGIDDTTPQFSWQSDSTERNWQQSGYEILVESTKDNLQSGSYVWDRGRQASSE